VGAFAAVLFRELDATAFERRPLATNQREGQVSETKSRCRSCGQAELRSPISRTLRECMRPSNV
jgi:hypothetical protein